MSTEIKHRVPHGDIMVVEDNRDIRSYVSGILSEYQLVDAESVEEANVLIEGNIMRIFFVLSMMGENVGEV